MCKDQQGQSKCNEDECSKRKKANTYLLEVFGTRELQCFFERALPDYSCRTEEDGTVC